MEIIDPRGMLAEMIRRDSFLSDNGRVTINRIRDRLIAARKITLREDEITHIRLCYVYFLFKTAPIFVSGGASGLGKRSSRWFDKAKLKDEVLSSGEDADGSEREEEHLSDMDVLRMTSRILSDHGYLAEHEAEAKWVNDILDTATMLCHRPFFTDKQKHVIVDIFKKQQRIRGTQPDVWSYPTFMDGQGV